MSHFTCMVVLPSNKGNIDVVLDDMLSKYSENLEVEPYETPCHCIGLDARLRGRQKAENELGRNIDDYRNEYHAMDKESQPDWREFISPLLTLSETYEKEDPFYNKPEVKCEECEGTGVRTTTYNPNSKWDWYEVGGRWKEMLLTKSGSYVDVAKIKEIDFETMREKEKQRAILTWEEAKKVDDGEKYFRYGILASETKEEYLKKRMNFYTFSVLTEDGAWYERGRMGWFATVMDEEESEEQWSDLFFERFIEKADPESTIVIVDCHI